MLIANSQPFRFSSRQARLQKRRLNAAITKFREGGRARKRRNSLSKSECRASSGLARQEIEGI